MWVGRIAGVLLVLAVLSGCQTLSPEKPAPVVSEGPTPAPLKPLEDARLRPEGPSPARPADFGVQESAATALEAVETAALPPDDLEEEIPDQQAAVTEVDLKAEGPQALVGRDQEWIEGQLGSPTLQEVRAPARVWSYNAPDCVISLFFYPKVAGGSFTVLTYEVAPEASDPEADKQCLDRLLGEKQSLAQSG
ncbi:hypothetical protein ACTL6U_07805 [Rhodovibrionaceae bacterium A322]